MKRIVLLALVLVTIPGFVGCTPVELTPPQIIAASYGTTYTASYAASYLFDKVSVDDIAQISEFINTQLLPYTSELEISNDLYDSFYPKIEEKIREHISNEALVVVTLGLISQSLRIGEQYLDQHPEMVEEKEKWLAIVNAVLKGVADGCHDAATQWSAPKSMTSLNES